MKFSKRQHRPRIKLTKVLDTLLSKAREYGRKDGIRQIPDSDSKDYPLSYEVIHKDSDQIMTTFSIDHTDKLEQLMNEVTLYRAELDSLEEAAKNEKETYHLNTDQVGEKEREAIQMQLSKIPQDINIIENDRREFEIEHGTKISKGLIPEKVFWTIDMVLIIIEIIMLVTVFTALINASLLNAFGLMSVFAIAMIVLPMTNAFLLRGEIQFINSLQGVAVIVAIIVVNVLVLYGMSILFELRAIDVIYQSDVDIINKIGAETFALFFKSSAYVLFLIACILAYLSKPNRYGQRHNKFGEAIKAKKKQFEQLRKELNNSNQISRRSRDDLLKLQAKAVNRIETEMYRVARKCFKALRDYHAVLEEGHQLYKVVKRTQRECFIFYDNTNKSFRNGHPMPQYDLKETTERFTIANPFDNYQSFGDLRNRLTKYFQKSKTQTSKTAQLFRRIRSLTGVSLLLFSVFFSSCGLDIDQQEKHLVYLIDSTEGNTLNSMSSSSEIFKAMTGIDYSKNVISGNYGKVVFARLNGSIGVEVVSEVKLENPSALYATQKAMTKKGLQTFKTDLDTALQEVMSLPVGTEHSRLYTNICDFTNGLREQVPQEIEVQIFVISDLIENSSLYNGYKEQSQLEAEEEQVTELFLSECKVQSFPNARVILKYHNPKNKGSRANDDRHYFFVKIYREILLKANINVKTIS